MHLKPHVENRESFRLLWIRLVKSWGFMWWWELFTEFPKARVGCKWKTWNFTGKAENVTRLVEAAAKKSKNRFLEENKWRFLFSHSKMFSLQNRKKKLRNRCIYMHTAAENHWFDPARKFFFCTNTGLDSNQSLLDELMTLTTTHSLSLQEIFYFFD